jgi:hypothetical protein
MATLAQQFLALEPQLKRAVHLLLCEHALKAWNAYTASHGNIKKLFQKPSRGLFVFVGEVLGRCVRGEAA